MNAEFNQTLRGRWTATRPLGLGVPKIKIRHHKKCLVQPDSLEAGAGIPAPLTAQGEPHVFFFLSLFLSFISFFLSFFYLAPVLATDWPRYWLSMLLCWPRYWLWGPGTGFLCFSAGPGTGSEAPVLALAAATWLVDCNIPLQTILCDKIFVLNLDQRCISCVDPWKSMVLV